MRRTYPTGTFATLRFADDSSQRAIMVRAWNKDEHPPYWVLQNGTQWPVDSDFIEEITVFGDEKPAQTPQFPDLIELARLGQLGLEVLQGKTRTARETPVWRLVTDFVHDAAAPPAKSEPKAPKTEPTGRGARVRTLSGTTYARGEGGQWYSVTSGAVILWSELGPIVSRVLYEGDTE